eukprot:GILJ01003083.1.p1 GENE.GILJ01003083.1~~GILJ01003083.1.p1  ORF type:complete len:369 (+),score=32.09 GILJ01003083.1:71-1177(+)
MREWTVEQRLAVSSRAFMTLTWMQKQWQMEFQQDRGDFEISVGDWCVSDAPPQFQTQHAQATKADRWYCRHVRFKTPVKASLLVRKIINSDFALVLCKQWRTDVLSNGDFYVEMEMATEGVPFAASYMVRLSLFCQSLQKAATPPFLPSPGRKGSSTSRGCNVKVRGWCEFTGFAPGLKTTIERVLSAESKEAHEAYMCYVTRYFHGLKQPHRSRRRRGPYGPFPTRSSSFSDTDTDTSSVYSLAMADSPPRMSIRSRSFSTTSSDMSPTMDGTSPHKTNASPLKSFPETPGSLCNSSIPEEEDSVMYTSTQIDTAALPQPGPFKQQTNGMRLKASGAAQQTSGGIELKSAEYSRERCTVTLDFCRTQ